MTNATSIIKKDLVSNIMDYEAGKMSEKNEIKFFSHLIKSGLAWSLQGHYGRTAAAMIDDGIIRKDGAITEKGRHFIKHGW